MSNKPSASKPSSATVPITGTAVLAGLGLPKTVTSGVTVAGELFRLWEANMFFVGETTRTILSDPKMKHFVGVPAGFKEKEV